jgi:hypothetical protein
MSCSDEWTPEDEFGSPARSHVDPSERVLALGSRTVPLPLVLEIPSTRVYAEWRNLQRDRDPIANNVKAILYNISLLHTTKLYSSCQNV